jgi:hypothetical protein
MDIDPKESFMRWQGVTRKHFTFTSNVILSLATGLLAFFSERFLHPPRPHCLLLLTGIIALLSLGGSIGLALWCSVNRLRDFRATARVARQRATGNQIQAADRFETKALGKLSWRLFWWQVVLFGVGVAGAGVVLTFRGLLA